MNKLLLPVSFAVIPVLFFGQAGKVFDNLSMTSKILNGERKYRTPRI